jgi:predicted RNA binding protein YcfA (HicA-like mRNA interferase family)
MGFQRTLQIASALGFEMRISGSHHFFRKSGIPEAINLQPAA